MIKHNISSQALAKASGVAGHIRGMTGPLFKKCRRHEDHLSGVSESPLMLVSTARWSQANMGQQGPEGQTYTNNDGTHSNTILTARTHDAA